MNLKEIIIEELRHTLDKYESRDNFEISIDIAIELEPMIEEIADNIIPRMDWQIISSGVARIDYVFDHKVLFIGYGHQPIYLLMKYIEDNHLDGKEVEIAVRVKE